MIVAGASAYSRIIDFARFGQIADEVGAMLFVDMAHIAGLVAAGLHPTPVAARRHRHHDDAQDAARPARRDDLLPTRAEHAQGGQQSTVFPGIQGGPLMHVIAAKAVAFGEALQPRVPRLPAAHGRPTRAILAETLVGDGVTRGVRRHRQPPDARRRHAARA